MITVTTKTTPTTKKNETNNIKNTLIKKFVTGLFPPLKKRVINAIE